MRWMLVDSRGSRKPDESPSATTFLSHDLSRLPGRNRTGLGSAIASPSRLASRVSCDFLVADHFGGIDVTVADPVLERDPPLPAGLSRGRARIGSQRFDARARHRLRPVAQQPMIPVLIADCRAHRRSEVRAFPSSRRTGRRRLRGRRSGGLVDEAGLGILDGLDDPALDAGQPRALRFRFSRYRANERCIEMIGIIEVRERRVRIARIRKGELVLLARDAVQRIMHRKCLTCRAFARCAASHSWWG